MGRESRAKEKDQAEGFLGWFGLPGEPGNLVVINEFEDPNDPRNEGGLGGLPGLYGAVVTLKRPGHPLTAEYQQSFEGGLKGDSHLAIAPPAYSPPGNPGATQIRFRGLINGTPYEWQGFPNERGFLGKIVVEPFQAANFPDAQRVAFGVVAPALSNWSAQLDIPLQIAQTDVKELRTGNTQASFSSSFYEVPLVGVSEATLHPEYRGAASIYREALESSSFVYRFLCLFKVIEGARSLRLRRQREAAKIGQPFSRPPETVPADPADFERWLNGIYAVRPPKWDPMTVASIFRPAALGKSFDALVGEGKGRGDGGPLRRLRHDIAHALWEPGAGAGLTLSADQLLHHGRVHEWLPLTHCVARYMMKHEFPDQFLSYLRDDGTIVS